MKICTSCGEKKSLSEFYKQETGSFGVTAACKTCRKNKDAVFRERKRDQKREVERTRYEQVREKKIVQMKNWRDSINFNEYMRKRRAKKKLEQGLNE